MSSQVNVTEATHGQVTSEVSLLCRGPPALITLRPKGPALYIASRFQNQQQAHPHILARPTPASFEAQRPKELGLVEVELLADGEGASPVRHPRVVGTLEEADAPLSIRWADRRGVPS
jgi:hypothetical protein